MKLAYWWFNFEYEFEYKWYKIKDCLQDLRNTGNINIDFL